MSTDSREFEDIEKKSLSGESQTSEMKSMTKIDENPLEFNFSEFWNSSCTLTSMQVLHNNEILIMSFTDGRIRIMSTPNLNEIPSNFRPIFLFDFQSNCAYKLPVLHFRVSQYSVNENLSSSEFEIITYNTRNVLSHWKVILDNKKNVLRSAFIDECTNISEHSSILDECLNDTEVDKKSHSVHLLNFSTVTSNNDMAAIKTKTKDSSQTVPRQGSAFHVGVSHCFPLTLDFIA